MAEYLKVSPHTLENLEWHLLKAELAKLTRTHAGKQFAEQLTPGKMGPEECRQRALAVLELNKLKTQSQLVLPLGDIPDVKDLLSRMSREGQITLEEFGNLARFHRGAQGLQTFLTRQMSHLPQTRELLQGIDTLDSWARETFSLLDPQGDLVDSASEDLRALRKLSKDLHEKIKRRLEDFLHSPKLAELMQDFYVTVRDGRYVLPIKSNFKGRVPGIIHDVSHTEATIFVEPEEVVDWNNQLKVAEKEIQKEIERILAEVVREAQPHIYTLRGNYQRLALADLLAASGELSLFWRQGLSVVEWSEEIHFEKLCHPLLLLQRSVVANTVTWQHGLVLTGPNTGGKTVLLKSVGLAVALVWSGLPVPALSASLPQNLNALFADIGDEQDLGNNLSTFSGHLLSIKSILESAHAGDLVLIDEIATGTSPEDGQPLAQAILESLLDADVRFLVTTHYGALKQFAMVDDRCRIAAMAFDTVSSKATYEVIMDIPGESSAFETATTLGLPPKLISRARSLRGEVSEDLAKAIQSLEHARQKMLSQQDALNTKISEAEQAKAKLELQIQEYREKQKQGLAQESKDILRDFNALRQELSQLVKSASVEDLKGGAQKLFTKISDAADQVRRSADDYEQGTGASAVPLSNAEIVADAVVEVENLGIGTIVEVPKDMSDKALVLVQVGELRTRATRKRLRKAPLGKVQQLHARRASFSASQGAKLTLAPTASRAASRGSSICDVRGKSADEALRRVEMALNDLLHDDIHSLTIVHGHGSGKLKESVRDYLLKKRGDLKFRSGTWPGEGDDGVTIVEK